MPIFIRKAFRLGSLLRLNISKSGMGVSVGVKGLRVSLGPRGNELYAGRRGLYFRHRLLAAWLKNPLNTTTGQRALLRVLVVLAAITALAIGIIVAFSVATR